MRLNGPALELRMRLSPYKEGMVRELAHLHYMSVRGGSGKLHPLCFKHLTVIIIYLVSVAVSFIDHGLAVKPESSASTQG